jgi:transposase InsO family protein
LATSRQKARCTSRRNDGAPGDFIDDRPVNATIHPAGLPINTPTIKVLQRPVESTQYTSFAFTQRLIDAGVDAPVGSVGDAYDNALAESTIGLFKAEKIRREGPWKTLSDVELATLEWVDWFNTTRLHSACGRLSPAEYEHGYLEILQTQ